MAIHRQPMRSPDDNSGLCVLLLHMVSSSSSCWSWVVALGVAWVLVTLLRWTSRGGTAWSFCGNRIPGPRGLPVLGSLLTFSSVAHRRLASLAGAHQALPLMAFSLASTRVIIASKPHTAREILCSPAFADRPLKQSAQQLLFGRAIGFAPYGDYWRNLRRIAATHLFSPVRISAHQNFRLSEVTAMLSAIASDQSGCGSVRVRPHLQHAALNNVMTTVFGRRYQFGATCKEYLELHSMVREGFELLGAFNIADHMPTLQSLDPLRISQRCADLVPRVYAFVSKIIHEHRLNNGCNADSSDFVNVLLALQAEEKLTDTDLVSILWEMIFRGTDTIAILTEWILAELVLHPRVQSKLYDEIETGVGRYGNVRDNDIVRMPYLQAVVKECLRLHPPGPLLSWARLAIHDVEVAGFHVPAGTTAMVNMWAISHDPTIWSDPESFLPERFLPSEGGKDIDVRGSDLRLAPFGAGRRVCPGKALGLATVNLWVARIVQQFQLSACNHRPVDLTEVLKLSCEMEVPLSAQFTQRF